MFILGYPGGPASILIDDFEDGRGSQAKECRQPLEAEFPTRVCSKSTALATP